MLANKRINKVNFRNLLLLAIKIPANKLTKNNIGAIVVSNNADGIINEPNKTKIWLIKKSSNRYEYKFFKNYDNSSSLNI
ncbi:hypothetical protein GCM10011444_13090 [Winogradskyella haliclonae]|uniref:Uncharacterized protein n=1 Tax=Winogradskyella haliclonae TaxID=2048558 RepID=A0ABQ2BX22_9FLAO|nr:hypothetical protein GCM10011444_13090 [Winogradskyella haliclonae]